MIATIPKPHTDTRPAQAARAANYLEQHPASLGYGLGYGWRLVACDQGQHTRQVRTYTLHYRPTTQPDLFRPE